MRRNSALGQAVLVASLLVLPAVARAGGPLIVDPDTGKAYAYGPGPVPVYYDQGNLAVVTDYSTDPPTQVVFDNAVGRHVVEKGYADWSSVPTTSLRANVVGDFSLVGLSDTTIDNVTDVIGKVNGGGIYVIFDADGSIMENFFGVSPDGILGISSPEFGKDGVITESWAVLNGQAIDPHDTNAQQYQGVATHEFGHSVGLAHTQTNGASYFYGAWGATIGPMSCANLPYASNLTVDDVETMYPYSHPVPDTGSGIAQANIHTLDDRAAISDLYPGPGWPEGFGTITGQILDLRGRSPLSGVNVVARNLSDPFVDANSTMSGEWTQGQFGPDGSFTLHGLKPGASYVLYVEAIFAGGFPTEPLWFLPGPEKFYAGQAALPGQTGGVGSGDRKGRASGNDASGDLRERNLPTAVDPCDYSVITAREGAVVRADIQFDHNPGAPLLVSLGAGAGASDVSGDGSVVVGNFGRGNPIFRWTEESGLEIMDGVLAQGESTFISRNGKYIASNLADENLQGLGAYRWDAEGGWRAVDPVGSCGTDATAAWGVANDGTVYGMAWNSCSDFKAMHWSPATGTRLLPSASVLSDGSPANGRMNQISEDGSVLVGWEENEGGERHGVVWVNGVPSRIENEHGEWVSEALSTSHDGSTISGMLFDGEEPSGAGWRRPTVSSALEYYGPLSADAAPAKAYAMSRDGSVMAGMSGDPWFSLSPAPFLWTRELGVANLDEFVRRQGGSMEQWATLWTPMAMSDDGSVIVGWGIGSSSLGGWVLKIRKALVCHGDAASPDGTTKTIRVPFPTDFDEHLAHGDTVGPCQDHPDPVAS